MDHVKKEKSLRNDEYLALEFNIDNIDRYYVRNSILKAIDANKRVLNGTLLDIGCGRMPYRSILEYPKGTVTKYIGLDLEQAVHKDYAAILKPDLLWDGKTIPLVKESVDSILLTEVLEHCFEPEIVLSEAYRVLKPGGKILITVPFLWPLHDIPYDEYRFTPYALEKLLKNAGYASLKIEALGGWHASLGQMIGLWLNRSGIGGWKRKLLYYGLFRHFIKWLYEKDHKPKNFYENPVMITGLVCIASK